MSTPTIAPSDAKPNAGPPNSTPSNTQVKSGRGRKPGTIAKERAEIPADEMQLVLLPDKQKADLRRKREERKPQQRAVDQIVYDIFQENVAIGMDRGTIADWSDLFVYDWPVSMTHAETALFYIRKACALYNRRPILGEQVEVPANKRHNVPDIETGEEVPCHLNGKEHIHIPFSVVRRARKSRAE